MKKLIALLLFLLPAAANAAFSTRAESAFLIDAESGAEIVAKNADTLMPPSSMLKLMTLAVTFDEIKNGDMKMTDRIRVPAAADYKNPKWRPASKICLDAGQSVTVRDLVMGTIVMSGGDAAVTLATKISGGEDEFAALMQRRAREIGMTESTFGNASGLPHAANLMTSRELAVLAEYLITRHADLYPLFATRRFEFNEYQNEWCAKWGSTHTTNYNKLLFTMPGAEGLKTGHTAQGGYGMVASAKRGGRRLIAVVNGFNGRGHDQLAAETKRLIEYGFDSTVSRRYYKPGDAIVTVPVWYGRSENVVGTVAKPFAATLPKNANLRDVKITARYNSPARAPIARGEQIGEITAMLHGDIVARAPIVAKEKVGRTMFIGRIWQNIKIIFGGK